MEEDDNEKKEKLDSELKEGHENEEEECKKTEGVTDPENEIWKNFFSGYTSRK